MKHSTTLMLLQACMLTTILATAETTDNFNSRQGISIHQVKGFLQTRCWFFADFDVNQNGWSPGIEGDGAMVSSSANDRAGIYTPLLKINGSVPVSFLYKFSNPAKDKRWLKIYATDGNNRIVAILDSVDLTGSDNKQVYHYTRNLSVNPGKYRIFINYGGNAGQTNIALDKVEIDAPTYYRDACNEAPQVANDNFTGTVSKTATGNVLLNDLEPNHELMTAYLLTDSPDGKVQLNRDGSFTFTPEKDFTGLTTHFVYKSCDEGYPALCSIDATATIHFPATNILPQSLVKFNAEFQHSEVILNWNTAAANKNAAQFEIERSLDGERFEKAGMVNTRDNADQSYTFTDKVRPATSRKNDLYYRLKQTDNKGNATYSKVLILRAYESKQVTAMSVTPDPDINDILVNVQLKENSFVVMKVSDNSGSQVMKKAVHAENGINTYSLEGTSKLQPGTYSLEIIVNSNERMTMKLVKS